MHDPTVDLVFGEPSYSSALHNDARATMFQRTLNTVLEHWSLEEEEEDDDAAYADKTNNSEKTTSPSPSGTAVMSKRQLVGTASLTGSAKSLVDIGSSFLTKTAEHQVTMVEAPKDMDYLVNVSIAL